MGAIAVLGTKANAVRRVITAKGGQTTTDGIRSMLKRPPDSTSSGGGGLAQQGKTFMGAMWGWVTETAQNVLAGVSATAVWGLIVATAQFILNFNWNTTDEEFEAAIVARERAWYGQLGETLGAAAGWFLCGAVPGMVLGTINEGLMLHVLKEVGEEGLEEVTGELKNLFAMGALHQMRNFSGKLFVGMRALIKRAANGDADTLAGNAIQMLVSKFPGLKPVIDGWGKKGSKSWTITGAVNEWVESFPDGNFKEFLEEFIDALGESCIEAGYVVAGGIDSWILNQKVAHDQIQGNMRVVEVLLDRSDPDSRVIVAGPERQVMQTLIEQKNQYMQLKRHDMGVIVGGEPVANTITTPGLPYARIRFSNSENKLVKPTYIDIKNIDRTKWDDWAQIKLACGGANGYMWGPWLVSALFPDNTTIRVRAASEQEGENLIEQLLEFTLSFEDLTRIDWSSNHQMKKGVSVLYESTYKSARKQYPWDFTIINPTRILNEENGKAIRSGIYEDRKATVPLWTDTAPNDFAETIAELFQTPGPNP